MKKLVLLFAFLLLTSTQEVKADTFENQIYQQMSKIVKNYIKKSVVNTDVNHHINDDRSLLEFIQFDTPHVEYSNLDELNRAGVATAYLTSENIKKSTEERANQYFQPTGYVKQSKIWDKGHLIAYSLTYHINEYGQYEKGHDGSLDNPKNLFTQTRQSNRGEMKQIENQIRDTLKSGEKVIYRVTPIFHNNELVAREIKLEAISEFGTLNINKTILNIQDGKTIDYLTGKVK